MKFLSNYHAALGLILLFMAANNSYASDQVTNLIVNIQTVKAGSTQQIKLNKRIMLAEVGQRFDFNLPQSGLVTFHVDSVKEGYQGSKTVSATSSDGEHLLLTMDSKAAFGNIQGNGLNFSISHDLELGQILIDQNNQPAPEVDLSNDALIPPGMSADLPGYMQMGKHKSIELNSEANGISSKSVVSILVLYSNEFANGFTSPTARINQMIEFTNQSYVRSGINIELVLARAQVLNFNNSTGITTLLSQITNGTGSFSGVEDLRDQYGADLVALLPFKNNNGSAGVAWVNGGNPNFAYSVTQMSPRCCDSVFAHELGHNLGSGHERQSANPNQFSPCDFNYTGYSCGHGNASNNWGTVMSYLNSGRVDYVFSNPNLNCLGEACGIPQGRTNAADNMRSFNITGPLVAAFRAGGPTPPPPPPAPTRPSKPNGDAIKMIPVLDLLLED